MTDGNMAIPVGPITEDDMNKLQSIFQRALDAIVGMSKLAAEVETLRQQVAQLTDDAERLRRANAGLDESLYQARTQRLALEDRLTQAEQAKATAQREAQDWQANANNSDQMYRNAVAKLDEATRDRDAAQYQVLELQDKLKAAEAKVASIHQALGIAVPQAPEPVPPPPVGTMVQPSPEPTPPAPQAPEPTPDWNSPSPPPVRTYFDVWQPGASWDDDRRQYYTEE